jgi:hypothetical protein
MAVIASVANKVDRHLHGSDPCPGFLAHPIHVFPCLPADLRIAHPSDKAVHRLL